MESDAFSTYSILWVFWGFFPLQIAWGRDSILSHVYIDLNKKGFPIPEFLAVTLSSVTTIRTSDKNLNYKM